MMVHDAARWVGYDEASSQLGLSLEATKRLALHHGWPRRASPEGGTQVIVLATAPEGEDEEVGALSDGPRTLIRYLELRIQELTDEVAEARTEIRGVRYEAESLRVDAARAQVFAALVEVERARCAEVKAERDSLAGELARRDRSWVARVMGALSVRPSVRRGTS